jgi:hypothetical protein
MEVNVMLVEEWSALQELDCQWVAPVAKRTDCENALKTAIVNVSAEEIG